MFNINAIEFYGTHDRCDFDAQPDECPFCHKSITPRIYEAFKKDDFLEIVFGCPDTNCGRIFLGQYIKGYNNSAWIFLLKSTTIGTFVQKKISENINNLSSNFIDIYNQAAKCEALKLTHIAGIGYRKSIEFLIKDYLIKKCPEKANEIKNKFLGKCIKDDIDNLNLKDIAERATWLGNDETHYIRKWENKDIKDLKNLIELTLHWIEMELLTEQYKNEMK